MTDALAELKQRLAEVYDLERALGVLAWDQQYGPALAQYDSLLTQHPGLREASLGRARTLAWSGRLDESRSTYGQILAQDSTDVEARLGRAQVSAWNGDLASAEQEYHRLLARNSRDVEARVGLGYVYLWQGREAAAGRQASPWRAGSHAGGCARSHASGQHRHRGAVRAVSREQGVAAGSGGGAEIRVRSVSGKQ